MSRATYSTYKQSGVDWIGDMPGTWEIAPVRRLFEIQKRIAGAVGFSVLSITQRGIKVKDTDSNEGQLSQDYSKYQLVQPGDFAMNHMDLLTGYVDIAPLIGVTSPDYRVFTTRIASEVFSRFYLYVFQLCYIRKIFYSLGQGSSHLGRWRLPADQFNSFAVPVPSLREQQAIASFLDRETDKLDTLIAKQERLIELLQEKRQAVISHAVTKGMDPKAPMKDSGVEWLGLTPAHWRVTRLKFSTSEVIDCPHETPIYDEDGDYLVIRTADIERGTLMGEALYRLNEAEYKNRIRRMALVNDDIVYGREGERWGHAALVPESNRYCLGQRMMQVRASKRTHSAFLMWQLNALSTYRQGQQDTVGATSPHVNVETIKNYWLTEPPLEEQVRIARHIDMVLDQIDKLVTKGRQSIDLMYEHRAALIAAAVTGKIDVREAA